MVQLIRLATATARGQNSALNTPSFPADFTVNIQNNITVSKNASVALKGLTFSTNDGVYIQTPIGLNVGISSQLGTTQNVNYKFAGFPSGKILVKDIPSSLFYSLLNAMDFNQTSRQTDIYNQPLRLQLTRGFYLQPTLDKDNKLLINYNCDPANEVEFFNTINSNVATLTITPSTGNNDNGSTSITNNTPQPTIDAGGCYCLGKKKLIMGSFQYKININNIKEDNKFLNNNFITGLVSQTNINKTTFLKDAYYCCVYPVIVNEIAYYAVYYNGQETITSVKLNAFDIVYWVMANGYVKCYVETRSVYNDNNRNGSLDLTAEILIPYSIDFNNPTKSGFYPCATLLNTNTKFLNTTTPNVNTKLGGSYYITSPTQVIDNDGNVKDYGLEIAPEDNILKASTTSLSGDVFERTGSAINISFENGLWSVLNTNLRLFTPPGAVSTPLLGSNLVGNGAIKLALYGDVIVELLNFDLSSYNSNYPDRKSILYVIERLEELGASGSNIYSFDVNYPIFLNIFNRDDITVNSFQIRITKDGVPLNLTGGATLTLLIDG